MASLGLAGLPVMQQYGGQMMQPLMQQQQQIILQPQAAIPHPIDANAITVKLATLAGERFKELFYTVFDSHRTVRQYTRQSEDSTCHRDVERWCDEVVDDRYQLHTCMSDLHRFFVPHSVLVWEGHAAQGPSQCKALFDMLPSSKHTVSTFDVQPVTGGAEMRGAVNTLLVTVSGTVTYGMTGSETAATPIGFFHSFVLERSQSVGSNGKHVHHVIQATMRTRVIEEAAPEQSVRKKRTTYGGRQ